VPPDPDEGQDESRQSDDQSPEAEDDGDTDNEQRSKDTGWGESDGDLIPGMRGGKHQIAKSQIATEEKLSTSSFIDLVKRLTVIGTGA
jgi:hypothetical protein